jgi:23S rRNA (guanosine2251-2'-O)-methyltransferase
MSREMLLYGRNSVFERLKTHPESIYKILLQDNIRFSADIEKLIETHKIPYERLSLQKLQRIKSHKSMQGIIAKVSNFQYASYDYLLDHVKNKELSLIFLDRINDPQNLGAIIRTLACFGGFALVIPKFKACEVTETVLHVACGGENYVSIAMVSNIPTAILKAKEYDCWIAGAITDAEASDITTVSFPFPLGIVLGFEGSGIRYGVQKNLDMKVRIPMYGARLSYNVSLACAILCYEIVRQRKES